MKLTRSVWIAILILVVWLVLSYFLGSWLALKSPAVWILRGGLWFIGIGGFVGYLLLKPKQTAAPLEGASAVAGNEIDFNFNEAAKRMQAAGIKNLSSLPTVFLLGDSDSSKTTVVARSGIDPQLLAGQAYQDALTVPTRSVNLWYGRNTLFVDPAGSVVSDPGARRKLFKKFLPKFNSVVGSKTPPTRTVVFTVDCGSLMQQGGAEAIAAKARQFQTILAELSQDIGASFPVYVLFTKADKIPYFRDFVENFSEQETNEVFGVTLPVLTDPGVYAEQQSRRLTESFQQLYYSLADRRPQYLSREHNAGILPNVYEFPREFAKLRPLLVQFLVDLCRPNQLGTSPFLRGFYFLGARAITINDVTPAAAQLPTDDGGFDAGATRMFNRLSRGAPMAAEVRESGARKTTQWVFLQHLFPGVILADRMGSSAAQSNVKLNFARRLLLASAAGLALIMAGWWAVSYHNNSQLINSAVEPAKAIPAVSLASGQLASIDSLRRLTEVKDTLAKINDYEEHGAPLSYRALLYTGNSVRDPLRTTYYALYRRLLLAPTQETLVQVCTQPDSNGSQDYAFAYSALKSYLITTSHHEKSTPEFLTPALDQHWKKGQPVDAERDDLARQNFAFYSGELLQPNGYIRSTVPDSTAVQNCRDYLNKFGQTDRIYQAMLEAAAAHRKQFVFNTEYPGSAQTVVNSYPVNAAYTKPGFTIFQKQLENPDKYFSGEEWVLGPTSKAGLNKSSLVQQLRALYQKNYIKTWQDYLKATRVVGYSGVPDAASKLEKTSSPESPLLRALCAVSENTAVPAKEISDAFQPVQFVTPPGCLQKPISPANTPYMNQLIALQGALKQVGPIDKADPAMVASANSIAGQAENSVSTLALGFQADPNDPKSPVLPVTSELLKEPITRVPPLLLGAGAGPANGAAGGLCAAISPMLSKYPFNSNSKVDATLQEVNDFLKPQDGKLWQLYSSQLNKYLVPAGDGYQAVTGQPLTVTQSFLNFFNRAARMSKALYKGDNPNFTFTMQPVPAPDVDHITLTIDGTSLSTDLRNPKAQTFTWPGATQGVDLKVSFGPGAPPLGLFPTSGLWAIWRFIDSGERVPGGSGLELQWVQRTTTGVSTINGHPAAVKFELDSASAQILRPQYFSGLNCASKALVSAR